MKKILYLEDDINLAFPIMEVLKRNDYNVTHHTTAENALLAFEKFNPDIILADVMLEGKVSGYDFAKIIRTKSYVPIIFTTALNDDNYLRKFFRISDSDYINKPFKIDELLLRIIKSLQNSIETACIILGKFKYMPGRNELRINEQKFHLSITENNVMRILVNHMHEYVSKAMIIEAVWGEKDVRLKEASLNNNISKLRLYLKHDQAVKIESRITNHLRITTDYEAG